MTERETLTLSRLAPVFEAHAVPEADRRLVYRVLDALMEEDCSHATAAECVRHGVLSGDVYEEVLASWNAGHRGIRTWFRQARCYEQVAPTAKGRSLLRDLAEVNPDWQDRSSA
ncbi:hypothetical protein SAMN05216360_101390 [Methylobacterium phyllostachyos]|uniref:Uncharacterized protein n=1 Tax=Methylobacterium phyllostachyos TaxID=582672 RepID=A0A1G9RX13_9HYPH|nr:hypothetical protein [Methylobacterium phyllostachyos]SDM27025.1 hypothetical protein SAMN05216360_101390 [Methylobacterium phyllostachyos]